MPDAQSFQELRLGSFKDLCTWHASRPSDRLEVDVESEIGFAGLGQRIGIGMVLHRLESVADAAHMAVVDDQRDATSAHDAVRDGMDGSVRFAAHFPYRAIRGAAEAYLRVLDVVFAQAEDQIVS